LGKLRRLRGKGRMPEPRGMAGEGREKERLTGQWSVVKPAAGRRSEAMEGKVLWKEAFARKRSNRAPEPAEAEKCVYLTASVLARRQTSVRPLEVIVSLSSWAPTKREEGRAVPGWPGG
jgi:hypothetical protein